jgi:hypothetical protein
MIAYVFWHVPADEDRYEARVREFHGALAEHPPPGFAESFAFRTRVPWMGVTDAFEDWYLVESLAALGELNSAAVDEQRSGAHAGVAAASGHGTGAIYELISGQPRVGASAAWVDKPRSRPYAEQIAELTALGGSIWQRQLVLGPAPEFFITSAARLPADSTSPTRERIWPYSSIDDMSA